MKLLTLAKRLDFTTETEYFDYCVQSYINGNNSQCKELFKAMTKDDRHNLISYIRDNYGNDEIHNYFVNLF
jgi:hypothetical protein